ncbi:O-antigen ligase family protein [Aurantimonas sp. A2-1-M11]|uniref:O-antigen ligase family protein n=1 Tax=Aurantimonas sp. A2-1-M11 TaxID=3113712 RepID=UPI002F95F600
MIKIGLGLLVVMAAVLGGDTVSNLNGDILMMATLLLFALALPNLEIVRIGYGPLVFAGVAIFHIVLQLFPFGDMGILDFDRQLRGLFLTLSFAETFRVLLSFVTAFFIFLVTVSLGYSHARGLLSFLYVAVYCNLLLGAVQFSSSAPVRPAFFDYPLAGGFFINQNHFSTFLAMFIPFLIFSIFYEERKKFALATLCLLLLILLAAGSMAGVGLGLVVMVVSALALMERRRISIYAALGGLVLLGVYMIGLENRVSLESSVSQETRLQFAMTTISGIRSYFWTGVGYGTFADAYPMFMQPNEIERWYVNHAHNDYLEIVFEGGVLALGLILAYLVFYIRQAMISWSDPFKRAAAISLAIILVHSIVDYPIRTYSLLFLFAMLNGVLFHRGKRVKMPKSKTLPIMVNGKEMAIPISPVSD